MLGLTEFNTYGSFSRYSVGMKKSVLKAPYDVLLSGYVRFCTEQRRIVPRQMNTRKNMAREFLFFIQIRGLEYH